jgi:hypothetical protein
MLFRTNATTIEGRVGGAAGALVLTISMNASTGEFSVTQNRAVEHNDPNDPDEAGASSAVMNSGLIGAVRSITDGDGDSASDNVDISQVIRLEDDGPGITGQPAGSLTPNNLVVKNVTGADGQDSSSYTLASGSDGLGSFIIKGPADTAGDFTWAYADVDGTNGIENNEIRGFYKGTALYTLELNDNGSYTFKMVGTLPGSTLNLTTAEIKAGPPDTNSIDVGAAENDQFVRISGESTVGDGNINESNGFVGVDSNNLDSGETLIFTLHNADGTLVNFTGISIGTKAPASSYHVVANLVGGGTYVQNISLGKDAPILVDPPGNALVSSIEITKTSGASTKIGVGDIDIFILPNDVVLTYGVRLTDGDGDFVDQSFTVSIDGNLDGQITNAVSAASTPTSTLASAESTSIDTLAFNLDQSMLHHFDAMLV